MLNTAKIKQKTAPARKILKSKWFLIIVAIVLLVLFDKAIPKLLLINRGVVIGLAIDMENEEIVLNSQLIMPTSSSNSKSNYSVFETKGRTIEEALIKIAHQLGNITSLGQVKLIILGNEVLERGDFSSLSYLMEQQRVSDNIHIVAAVDKASDILRADVVIEDVSTYHFQRAFTNKYTLLGQNRLTLKDFFRDFFTHAGRTALPVAAKVPTEIENPDGESTSSNEVFLIDMDKTAIISRDGLKAVLNKDESDGYTLMTKEVDRGGIETSLDEHRSFNVNVLKTELKKSLDLSSLTVNCDLKVRVRFLDRRNPGNLNGDNALMPDEKAALEEYIKFKIISCFEKCKEAGVDVFNFYDDFYKKFGNKFANAVDDDYLSYLKFNINVEVIPK